MPQLISTEILINPLAHNENPEKVIKVFNSTVSKNFRHWLGVIFFKGSPEDFKIAYPAAKAIRAMAEFSINKILKNSGSDPRVGRN